MGLAETFKAVAEAAVGIVEDLLPTVTYTSVGTTTYNPTDQTASHTDQTYTISKAVLVDFEEWEVSHSPALRGMQKMLVPANHISFTPKADDYVTIGGDVFDVKNISKDPAGALWQLTVKLKG
jgi:hypothetical protein